MTTNIDYEHIYKLTYLKQWDELLTLVSKYSKSAASDERVMRAVKTFEDEFFGELDKGIESNNLQHLLNNLFLLHKGRTYQLSEERFTRVVVKLVEIYSGRGLMKEAYGYAQQCPKNEICAEIVELHQESLPRVVNHSQSNHITVTENRKIAHENYTTSLFKSKQETEFFKGVRDAFPMFVVYPNVALSCVVNFEKIKDHLSQEERNFFFMGIIDCVVFDQFNHYKPTRFYELDSPYHDLREQKQKDSYKDKILSLAGQKIYRIRKTSDNQGINEFTKLVMELM